MIGQYDVTWNDYIVWGISSTHTLTDNTQIHKPKMLHVSLTYADQMNVLTEDINVK
jgi:hypothetical protein